MNRASAAVTPSFPNWQRLLAARAGYLSLVLFAALMVQFLGFIFLDDKLWSRLFFDGQYTNVQAFNYQWFFWVIMPLSLLRLWVEIRRKTPEFRWVLKQPLVVLTVLMLGFANLTLLWSDFTVHYPISEFQYAPLHLLIFLLAILLLRYDFPHFERVSFHFLIITLLINALISIYFWLEVNLWFWNYWTERGKLFSLFRLSGFGMGDNAIIGGMVSVHLFVFSFVFWRLERNKSLWQVCLYAMAMVAAVFTILMGVSRGALLVLAIVAAILFIFTQNHDKQAAIARLIKGMVYSLIIMALLALAIWLITRIVVSTDFHIFARGSAYRLAIWQFTLEQIAHHPWIGYGIAADLPFYIEDYLRISGLARDQIMAGTTSFYNGHEYFANQPHSLYLGIIYYTGIIGFSLFTAVVMLAIWHPFKALMTMGGALQPFPLILVCLWMVILVGGSTNLSQLYIAAYPLGYFKNYWYLLWLVLGLSFTVQRSARS